MVGHGLFESKSGSCITVFVVERAPALFTNLLFAGIAPFFVVVEMEQKLGWLTEREMGPVISKVQSDVKKHREKLT